MDISYLIDVIDQTMVQAEKKIKSSSPSEYDQCYIDLNELKKAITKNKTHEEIVKKLNILGQLSIHEMEFYDKEYSNRLSNTVHAGRVYYDDLSKTIIEFTKNDALKSINKALLEYQIARSENIKLKLYTEPLRMLETMKSLLNNEEWPEPTFPESTALKKFITANKNDLNEALVKATQKAVENFDEYYDYLDPSYRQAA